MSDRRDRADPLKTRSGPWIGPLRAFVIALITACASGGVIAGGLFLAMGNFNSPLPLYFIAPGALALGSFVLGAARASMMWIALAASVPVAVLSLPLFVGGSPRERAFIAMVMVGYLLCAVVGFGLGRLSAWFVERLGRASERGGPRA